MLCCPLLFDVLLSLTHYSNSIYSSTSTSTFFPSQLFPSSSISTSSFTFSASSHYATLFTTTSSTSSFTSTHLRLLSQLHLDLFLHLAMHFHHYILLHPTLPLSPFLHTSHFCVFQHLIPHLPVHPELSWEWLRWWSFGRSPSTVTVAFHRQLADEIYSFPIFLAFPRKPCNDTNYTLLLSSLIDWYEL